MKVADTGDRIPIGSRIVRNNEMLDSIFDLPKWDKEEISCFLTLERKVSGKEEKFVVRITESERKAFTEKESNKMYVPVGTMPTWGFDEYEAIEEDFKRVFEMLVTTYKKYLYFTDPIIFELKACSAMSTYFREVFNTAPMWDFVSVEFNSGKTTASKALTWSSFHGLFVLDPSKAALFRAIDTCKSTVGIDELDRKLDNKEVAGDFIGLLNGATTKGTETLRCNTEMGNRVESYDAFGLKSYTHTDPVSASFESRSIVVPMVQSPKKISKLRSARPFTEARDILYSLRLFQSEIVEKSWKWTEKNNELKNRDEDKFLSLLTMAKVVSDSLFDKLHKWAIRYCSDYAEEQIDPMRRAFVELLLERISTNDIQLKEFSDRYYDVLCERGLVTVNKDGTPKYRKGAKAIMTMIRSIGGRRSEYNKNGYTYFCLNKRTLKQHARRYGLIELEEGPLEKAMKSEAKQEPDPEPKPVICKGKPPTKEAPLEEVSEPLKDSELWYRVLPTVMQRLVRYWRSEGLSEVGQVKMGSQNQDLLASGIDAGVIEEAPMFGNYIFTNESRIKIVEAMKNE